MPSHPSAARAANSAALYLRLAVGAALSAAAVAGAPALADPVDAKASQELQEIVITAEKRESTVQKTPISITAIAGTELQAQGLSDLTAVAQQVPGLSFKTSGPGQTEFEMRGLTSTGGEAATVGFYLDDTVLTPPGMAQNGKPVVDPNLFDANRVEVLRGPQGTLYGASSMGGTIKLVTNQPDPAAFAANVEGTGSGTTGGGFNHTENLMLNIPLIDNVAAVRVVGTDKDISGWIKRDVLNPFPLEVNGSTQRGDVAGAPVQTRYTDSNHETLRSIRGSVLVQLNERFSVTAAIMHQDLKQDGPSTIDSPPLNEVHYQPFDVAEPFSDTFNLYSLNLKYKFDGAELTSATAQFDREQDQTQDISEAMQFYIGGFFGPPASWPYGATDLAGAQSAQACGATGNSTCYGFGAGSISETDYSRQFSEEVRLTSTSDGPLQWLVGVYYSNFGATSHVFSFYPNTPNTGFAFDFGTNNLADNHRYLTRTQTALFGEGSYLFAQNLKLTLGARVYDYKSDSITSVSGVSANGTSAPLFGHASNSGVTPKLNLAYLPDADTTLYGTVSKGFRPGGPNSPIPLPKCVNPAPTQFGPDDVWNYELGEKLRFLNSRITVNGAVYYEDWSNVQQKVLPGCGFSFTANAGKAKVYGAELELSFVLAQGFVLSQNFGYTHATNSTTLPSANVVSGQRLFDVPEVTANTSITFTQPLVRDLAAIARLTNTYVDSIQDPVGATPTNLQGINTLPSYDIVALRAGVQTPRWSALLFVDNLTNKVALLSDTTPLSTYVSILNRVATNQPRTIGVDLSYKF